jgi:hypothetical protein
MRWSWIILSCPDLHVLFVHNPQLTATGLHSEETHQPGHVWPGPCGPWDSVIWDSTQSENDPRCTLKMNKKNDHAEQCSLETEYDNPTESRRKSGAWAGGLCSENVQGENVVLEHGTSFSAKLWFCPHCSGLWLIASPLLSIPCEADSHKLCVGPHLSAPTAWLYLYVIFYKIFNYHIPHCDFIGLHLLIWECEHFLY